MTSTEFLEWVWFLNWSATEEFRREDFYLAQIAALIERAHFKGSRATIADKILEFRPERRGSATDQRERIAKSKAFWMALTGADRKGVRKGRGMEADK